MRIVTLYSKLGGTVSWEADEDVILSGITAFNVGILSLEPELTLATWGASLSDLPQTQMRIVVNVSPTGDVKMIHIGGLSIELLKYQLIFYAPSAGDSTVQLFLLTKDDISQLKLSI